MPRPRLAIFFRLIVLYPMFLLGQQLFYFERGVRANHWLAKDGKPVSAVVTDRQDKRALVYYYRYAVDGKEYTGSSVRDWEDEDVHRLAVGEETSVVISESHPWFSSFKPRQTSLVAFPIVAGMILFECLCFVALVSPRSLSFLSAKQQQPADENIQRLIRLTLLQAQRDGATEMVVGIASPFGVTVRYKVEDAWREMPPFSSHIRRAVASELARMAGFPAGEIPGEGVLDESLGNTRLRWIVAMTSIDGECMLKRVDD
jgi:hypothetical protein